MQPSAFVWMLLFKELACGTFLSRAVLFLMVVIRHAINTLLIHAPSHGTQRTAGPFKFTMRRGYHTRLDTLIRCLCMRDRMVQYTSGPFQFAMYRGCHTRQGRYCLSLAAAPAECGGRLSRGRFDHHRDTIAVIPEGDRSQCRTWKNSLPRRSFGKAWRQSAT